MWLWVKSGNNWRIGIYIWVPGNGKHGSQLSGSCCRHCIDAAKHNKRWNWDQNGCLKETSYSRRTTVVKGHTSSVLYVSLLFDRSIRQNGESNGDVSLPLFYGWRAKRKRVEMISLLRRASWNPKSWNMWEELNSEEVSEIKMIGAASPAQTLVECNWKTYNSRRGWTFIMV